MKLSATALSRTLVRVDVVTERGHCSLRVACDDAAACEDRSADALLLCGPFPKALASAAGRVLVSEASRKLLALSVGCVDTAERCSRNERIELQADVVVCCLPVQGCCLGTCDWAIYVAESPVLVICGARLKGTPPPPANIAPLLLLFGPWSCGNTPKASLDTVIPSDVPLLAPIENALPRGLLAAFGLTGANLDSLPLWCFKAKGVFKETGVLPRLGKGVKHPNVVFCLAEEAWLIPDSDNIPRLNFSTSSSSSPSSSSSEGEDDHGERIQTNFLWSLEEARASCTGFSKVFFGPNEEPGANDLRVGETVVLHGQEWVERLSLAAGGGCHIRYNAIVGKQCTITASATKRLRVEAESSTVARDVAARLR